MVEVTGTVKNDNNDFVVKQLQNARRACDKVDWAETEKYYNLVKQNDPTNVGKNYTLFYDACNVY